MNENCYITETARGFTLHCADGSVIDGQATYADTAKLARRNGYTVVPPPPCSPDQIAEVEVVADGQPIFRASGTAGAVALQLAQFCQAHGLR